MTRPDLVRADTLDLQDPTSPSAKDHSRQPASPKPLGDGPPAPHQAQSLRKVSLDGYDLHVRSPRGSKDLSDKELQLLHDPEGDDHEGAGDGMHGHGGEQDMAGQEMGADEDDDDLDDDMIDKISSSPSIDDGVYNSLPTWPQRADSLLHNSFHHNDGSDLRRIAGRPVPRLRSSKNKHVNASTFQLDHKACGRAGESDARIGTPSLLHGGSRSIKRSRFRENLTCQPTPVASSPDKGLMDTLGVGHLAGSSDPVLHGDGYDNDAREIPSNTAVIDSVSDSSGIYFAKEHSLLSSIDDDDPDLWHDERFVDSGWGGECLRETEDIDFEFVYALHTFVATVEGQANATKGDTMVLLDDSNSYWWLVKVVKDSSIGYLPAEHIETPTERLARLNKHRNIDVGHPSDDEDDDSNSRQLSQTMLSDNQDMLGDSPEKSRNPLKIAMRRRNAKTVQFTDPIYYEPSERSYSSDEDEEEDDLMSPIMQNGQEQTEESQAAGDPDAVEPLQTSRDRANANDKNAKARSTDGTGSQAIEADKSRTSQDTLDSQDDSKGGRRIRNTDSFYKDEETRKISLTPGILRDEASSTAAEDSRASLDSQKSNEKHAAKEEKPKEKEKKKSGGVLGFFKRKNSKSNKQEKEEERDDLSGTTVGVSPQQSSESLSHDSTSITSPVTSPQSQKHGKLQKTPPKSSGKRGQVVEEQTAEKDGADATKSKDDNADLSPAPLRQGRQDPPAPLRLVSAADNNTSNEPRSPGSSTSKGLFSPIQTVQTMLSSGSGSEPKEPKPEKVKKAKNRMALEDSDVSEDDVAAAGMARQQQPSGATTATRGDPTRQQAGPYALDTSRAAHTQRDRLSESPIEISPITSSTHLAPAMSSTSHLDVPPSPVSAMSAVSGVSTPELVERPNESESARSHLGTGAMAAKPAARGLATGAGTTGPSMRPAPTAMTPGATPTPASAAVTKTPDVNATPSTSTMSSPVTAPSTPQWSPAALRAYLEADGANDVRDLMLLVQDTSGIKGLPQHHELMRAFDGERKRLDGMQKRLDNLLGEILSRKPSTSPISAS